MIEVRIHGRGGQGSVTSSQIIATAAFFDGKHSQAFPMFGVERSGAPVMALARIDDKEIHDRSQVYEPDYVIVLDSTVMDSVDVKQGLKKELIVNTKKDIKGIRCVDASQIAIDVLGNNFVNVIMVGAFAAFTNLISLNSVLKAIDQRFEDKNVAEKNKSAVKRIYEKIKNK